MLYIGLAMLMLSGCLYPQDRLSGGMEALPGHVEEVQHAVDRFVEENSVLPIKTVEADTPQDRKYVIDFSRLTPVYLAHVPPSAFEEGGSFMYVLIDVEDAPKVKVFDLRVSEELRPVQSEINAYTAKHGTYPRGDEIAPGVFALNEALLRHAGVTVPSPYYPENRLPLVMGSDGTVYVDYRKDLMRILQESGEVPSETEDIRSLLTADSLFVPAHSLPYRYDAGDAVFNVTP